ncbi:MAG: nickel pincer cofactor biosynthesis protein LarB [Candidatus Aenigmarchaeota archaeon]|nr:nickel pincer cofactor biosynthesis protein LarB [Candidatus Aenigmarchaeota archaeon]
MEKEQIIKLLDDFKKNKISTDEALEKLKCMPFEDLGFAKVDHHRVLRNGFPEVVLCRGKTTEQILKIFQSMEKTQNNVLLTRAEENVFEEVKKINKDVKYNALAKTITLEKKKADRKGKVLVICAGTADIPVAEEAIVTLEIMGNEVKKVYDVGVAGLPRLLKHLDDIYNATCIIAIAGMDGACVPTVAGLASCPVIAVPTSVGYGASFGGVAPLLTMLNCCAPGVAVVNIDNGFGAGYFASLINNG